MPVDADGSPGFELCFEVLAYSFGLGAEGVADEVDAWLGGLGRGAVGLGAVGLDAVGLDTVGLDAVGLDAVGLGACSWVLGVRLR